MYSLYSWYMHHKRISPHEGALGFTHIDKKTKTKKLMDFPNKVHQEGPDQVECPVTVSV